MRKNIKEFIFETKRIFKEDFVPLHRPIFIGNEKKYLNECIDSNFVSSVGKKVYEFEQKIAKFLGASYSVATVNGTSALHIALVLSGVRPGEEVITQPLNFVATCNAISYIGGKPIFVDVDQDTLGLSPKALLEFLCKNTIKRSDGVYNKKTGKKISACIPMHTFGFPCRIKQIHNICSDWGIKLIEDAAESLGSYVGSKHTGTFSLISIISFNGNKIITTGGGGMIVTNDLNLARKAKHITTNSKIPHAYEFLHDEIGYNYRMPNINAALGCAQMEKISFFLSEKKKLAKHWENFFTEKNIKFFKTIKNNKPNFWLNTLILKSKKEQINFLEITNKDGVMTRPVWKLMSELPMFKNCQNDGLKNALWLKDRIVNIPSSVPNNPY